MAKYEDILEEIRKRTELANTNLNNAQDAINYGQNNGRSYESLDTQLKNSRAITRDYAADIKRIANKNNIAYSNTEELTPTLSSLASKNINKKAWEQDSKLPKNIVDIAKRNEKELQNEKKRFNETIGNTQEYKDYQYRINKLNPTLSYSRDVAELNEKGINGLDKTFAPLLSGLDNIKISNSFKQSDNSRVNLPTLNDLKTQKATENANWLYKGYADISQSIGNMLPGIAASAINPALGSALFFGNTYKNAVNDALLQGYDLSSANNYGLINATLELGVGKVLGGTTALLGKSPVSKLLGEKITSKIVLNPALSSAISDMASEFGEEYIQEWLDPKVKAYVLDKKDLVEAWDSSSFFDIQNFYAGLLGALSAGITNTPGTIRQNSALNSEFEKIVDTLQKDGNEKLTNEQLKQLKKTYYKEYNKALKNDTEIDYENISNKLTKGIRTEQSLTNDIEQLKEQQKQTTDNKLKQELATKISGLEQELNQFKLPMASTEGMNLMESASKYNIKPETQSAVQNLMENRGIESRWDATKFSDNSVNALWTKDANGNRSVIFNPNASLDTIVEEVALHELTHDILSSENTTLNAQEILDYVSQLDGYNEARRSLENTYSTMYDPNSAEFNSLIDEEVVADVLGRKLGNQEFINQLVNSKPSIAKSIYNWVISKLNSIVNRKGIKNEKLYWQNIKNNFENAYKQEYKNNEMASTKYKASDINTDSQGRALSKQQQEFFKDSKARDKNGNLITVYHTTTDSINPFYEFNPVGTQGYRFDNDVVNFYTNSKTMSGSYADYKYKMANTKITKLNSLSEVNDYINNFNKNNNDNFEVVKDSDTQNGYLLMRDNSTYEEYSSKNILLRSVVDDINNITGEKTNYQYEGYVNITNPYIIDAKEENWDNIVTGYNTYNVEHLLKLDDNLKQQLIDLANESIDFEKNARNKIVELQKKLGEIATIYGGYTNAKKISKEFNNLEQELWNAQDILTPNEQLFEDSYFTKNGTELLEKVNNDTNNFYNPIDVFKAAKNNFEENSLKDIFSTKESTNDIIKNVLRMNKNGSNYDGVIIKKVLDYGSTTEFDDTGAAQDVYVTFNSNQFKAADNTNPTSDADIRYSKENEKWNQFLEKNIDTQTKEKYQEMLVDIRNNRDDSFLNRFREKLNEKLPGFFNKNTNDMGVELSKGQQEYFKNSKARGINDSLKTVFHTTTDELPQFNEFNPVGTQYYRFGNQVVNYYTDSKEMSGSYASQDYKMADTKKLNNMEDLDKYLTHIGNLTGNEYKVSKHNGMLGVTQDKQISKEARQFIKTLTENEKQQMLDHIYEDEKMEGSHYDRVFSWNEFDKELQNKYHNLTNKYLGTADIVAIQQEVMKYLENPVFLKEDERLNGEVVGIYDTEEELLKNIKSDMQKQDWSKNTKLQYEGYVNITNPYVIDAEARNWNQVISESNDFIDELDERIPEEIKNNLTRLYNESANKSNKARDEYDKYQEIMRKISNVVLTPEIDEETRKMNHIIQRVGIDDIIKLTNSNEPNIGVSGWYSLADILKQEGVIGSATSTFIVDEFKIPENVKEYLNRELYGEINFNGIKNLYELYDKNKKAYEEFEKYRYPNSYFLESISSDADNPIHTDMGYDLNDMFETRAEIFGPEQVGEEIAQAASVGFSKPELIRLWGTSKTTNDIVKEIIASNQDGTTNYDGVIIKNVVDYGGRSQETTPQDLYITFNSNQFKAVDNENPTSDPDIRYSKQSEEWDKWNNKTIAPEGTKTKLKDIKLPKKEVNLPKSTQVKQETRQEVKLPTRETITKEELEELDSLKALNEITDLSREEQNRLDYLEKKQQGYTERYPGLKKVTDFKEISREYGKYRDLDNFDKTLLRDAESMIKGYRNTERRTKDEWLSIARYIGSNFKGNSEELQKYAIQSWFAAAPNQKGSLNRQGKGFVDFKIQEWINSMYDGARVGELDKPSTPKKQTILPMAREDNVLKVNANEIADFMNGINGNQRGWAKTATESDVLKDKVLIKDLDASKLNYVVESNQKSVDTANNHLNTYGYEKSLEDVKSLLRSDKLPKASDVALAERVLQEAVRNGDTKTAQDLIMDIAILGTDLGQATQALSIIKRLTPEGQLSMYTKMIQRAKSRGEKSFENVEITPEMVEMVLNAYKSDGTYDQEDLNNRVENFKQEIANQMKTTTGEKINAWRYLAMLGNPKTHIRNMLSNAAMTGTIKVKNAMARTLESVLPIKNRTKTWKKATNFIKNYAETTANEMKGIITGENKYNEKSSLESKKRTFKSDTLEKISNFNSNRLEAEDWFFSKRAFKSNLEEYLTANGINTQEDIENNPELIEKAKNYAKEQAEIATFRQYSKLAAQINNIEKNNKLARFFIEATVPFKKTPINVAKAGVKYSPLGLIKSLSYDIYQVKQGNMEASQLIDNISQGLTGTSLTILGYALAKNGILNGGGDDDKEGKYDTQLGDNQYSLKIGDKSYSISWLSPVAMPLLVGANAFEQLEEKEEWDMNVVSETLAKTLDPLNEMSFMQGLTNALSSYNSGVEKLAGIGESVAQNYVGQFFPTLFSQFASTIDDKKRSTKASANSTYKFGEQTLRSIMYKLPGLRQKLEVATDVWGNEKEQADNIIQRAYESFLVPYSTTKNISTDLDKEIKRIYNETGETKVIPGIPYSYVKYNDETYRMSANEYTKYKKTYGTTASSTLSSLIKSDSYKNASDEDKAKMIDNAYDYARAKANEEYFSNISDVNYENKTLDKLNTLKSEFGINASTYYANKNEYDYAYQNPNKYKTIKQITSYNKYSEYKDKITNIKENTKNDKEEVINYINSLNLSIPQKAMFIKQYYKSFNNYDNEIINYINSQKLSSKDKQNILEQLGFKIRDGRVYK